MTQSMGDAAGVLAKLDALGIQLLADGDRLRYRPRDKVPADLVELVKIHKADLITLVCQRELIRLRIDKQMGRLVPYRISKDRHEWIDRRYQREMEQMGLFE